MTNTVFLMPKKSMPVEEKAAWIGACAVIAVALIGLLAHTANQPQIIVGGNSVSTSQSFAIATGNGVATATSGNNPSTVLSTNLLK